MKFLSVIAGLVFCVFPLQVSGNFFKDYLKDRYPVKIVAKMPAGIVNEIVMVSTRNIDQKKDFKINRGLEPHYRISIYMAGLHNDTAYIIPLRNLDDISRYLNADRSFLVMVDGHGKTFGQAMERGFELSDRFSINMIVFDWPTDYFALRKTIYNADEVAANFVRAMRNLDEVRNAHYPNSSVSVIFHSMGNHIIKEIGSTKLLEYMPEKLFSNIIINAAAVKQHNHAKWVEKLDIQKRVYITINERDMSLRGAAMLRMAKQLGMTYRKKAARNALYVNFNDLETNEHNLFLGRSILEKSNPGIFTFYDEVFHGKEVRPGENFGFHILSPSDKSFLFSER